MPRTIRINETAHIYIHAHTHTNIRNKLIKYVTVYYSKNAKKFLSKFQFTVHFVNGSNNKKQKRKNKPTTCYDENEKLVFY